MWPFKKKWIPKVGDRVFLSPYRDNNYYDATILHVKRISIRTTYWVIRDDHVHTWNEDLDWSENFNCANTKVHKFDIDSEYYDMIPMTDEDKKKIPAPEKVLQYLREKEKIVIIDIPMSIENEIKELLTEMPNDDILEILRGIKTKKEQK
jgi:hypothetical protein